MLEEHAFMSECFPCNSIPFLTRLRELLTESQTNGLTYLSEDGKLKARACMWILMAQLYGQMATINLSQEWDTLNEALNPNKIAET